MQQLPRHRHSPWHAGEKQLQEKVGVAERMEVLGQKVIRDYNPWVNHIDFDAHGYGIASIHYDYVDMLYYRVSDVEDPDAAVSLGTKRQWRIGEGFVEA